jgi:molecular chaperone DnaK
MSASHFLGIDLGTTNSAQAAHDGDTVKLVRTADGSVLTPSVVRIDARSRVSVGSRARSHLASDPENTRGEFKRLMGSGHKLGFAAAGLIRSPIELSAEVLKSLRRDFSDQHGHEPMRAIVSVPALFELPQLSATSEAARLAGFERVEFIQEPIASAMAAGWSEETGSGSWLVYDLGGGTFDASLLESREGVLRVVGHDGDNFLGGRDIDQGLADWVLSRLAEDGVRVDVTDPALAPALRRLRASCELSKIELTRAAESDLVIEDWLELGGRSVSVDLVVPRAALSAIVARVVDRSLEVCLRLLTANGLSPEQLERVVLVGGPTLIPGVRERIATALSVTAHGAGDPMTLVAEGAALFALSQNLSTKSARATTTQSGPSVWLQYSAVSSDLNPYVVGKVGATGDSEAIRAVLLERSDGGFRSPEAELDAERAFALPVELVPRGRATFNVWGQLKDGRRVALEPSEFTITHGVSLGDPPLSRTLGIALANDEVRVFFERGSPLPNRRSFTLHTVETVSPGNLGFALRVPIVQGEFLFAHLCRLVGTLEIAAEQVRAAVPAGSAVEVTLELDRGGRLVASARIAAIDQNFQHVAHLVAPDLAIDTMRETLTDLTQRGAELRAEAFRSGVPKTVRLLQDLDSLQSDARRAIDLAAGGDPDASERARRLLLDLDGLLSEAEQLHSWPKLEAEANYQLALEGSWVGEYGTGVEKDLFAKAVAAVERALMAKNGTEVKRQLQAARGLGNTAYFRNPEAWPHALESAASRLHELSEPLKGKALVEQGRRAIEQGDKHALETAVNALHRLLPPDAEQRKLGHDSGVR